MKNKTLLPEYLLVNISKMEITLKMYFLILGSAKWEVQSWAIYQRFDVNKISQQSICPELELFLIVLS